MKYNKIITSFILLILCNIAQSNTILKSDLNTIFKDNDSSNVLQLTDHEMSTTEGEIAPLIYIVGSYVVRYAGKKIIKHYIKKQITKKMAIQALKNGKSIYVKDNRIAKSIANKVYGKKDVVRHLSHKRSPVWKPHYQTSPNTYNSHVFYGG